MRLVIPGSIMLVAGIYSIKRYHETHKGRRVLDKILLKLPVMGMILRKIAVARFCRTLATLISSGVPILDGLEITARTSGSSRIRTNAATISSPISGV